MEIVTDFIFLSSKITADGDCSNEIKRSLFLGRKAMTNLDSILKSGDVTLPTKIHIVRGPVVTYRCENWTIKKAEHWRIDAFKLWCCRRLLRAPWTARSNQSTLKEINSWILIGKACDAEKDWRKKEKRAAEDEMIREHHQLNGHESEQTPGDSEGQGRLACCSPWGHKE